MRRGLSAAPLAAAAAIAALAVAGPAGALGGGPEATAAKAKSVKVKVADDYFAPVKLTVKKGTKVKWKWLPDNGNPHNVTLTKGPRGIKKKDYRSVTGSIGIKFNRKLPKAGTYNFVCTLHRATMYQKIKVKR